MQWILITFCNVVALEVQIGTHMEQFMKSSSFLKMHENELREHGELTLGHALKNVKNLPESVTSMLHKKKDMMAHHESRILVAAKNMKMGVESAALTKARDVLNALYDEAVGELDIVNADCAAFMDVMTTQLDENARIRSEQGAAIAKSRADIARSSGAIEQAKSNLRTLNSEFEEHANTCTTTLAAADAQIAILEGDLATGERIKNMTKCSQANVDIVAETPISLMECRKGSKGGDTSYELHSKLGGRMHSFHSEAANFALQRAGKIALGRHLGKHSYSRRGHTHNDHHPRHLGLLQTTASHSHEVEVVRHTKRKATRGDPGNTTVAADSPALEGNFEGTYVISEDMHTCTHNGCVTIATAAACLDGAHQLGRNVTAVTEITDTTAQGTSPRGCSIRGSEAFFNPTTAADDVDGSANSDKPICKCEIAPETANEEMARLMDEPPKCSVANNKNCPKIYDAISTMVSEIADGLVKLKDHRAKTHKYCTDVSAEYTSNIKDEDTVLNENNVILAEATDTLNANEEGLRVKMAEFDTLSKELYDKQVDCFKDRREIADYLCGIKVVRTELYQMSGTDPFIQDCEVSDWVPEDCSVQCGPDGGTQFLRRTVVVEANFGASCPPLQSTKACNVMPCPIDCQMGDWSPWSACSKDCGGGLMQRSRDVDVPADHGGEVCDATQDARQCNQQACSGDCVLMDWNDWNDCSKECDGGLQFRYKYKESAEYGPEGWCADEHDGDRVEMRDCNTDECNPSFVCTQQLDIVMALDGSGSVGYWPFQNSKAFAQKIVDHFSFGPNTGKMGIVLFSYYVEIMSGLTFNAQDLDGTLRWLHWPGWTTNTAEAISTAMTMLAQGGRGDADSVVFIVTDGMPDDSAAVSKAAEEARKTARVIFVAVGENLDQQALESWASFPPESNVLHAENFEALDNLYEGYLADMCKTMGCNENMSGNGQDYIGCQNQGRGGKTCQIWDSSSPWAHWYTSSNYPGHNLGEHNYCRNPDGDSSIWCVTADSGQFWDYCDPK